VIVHFGHTLAIEQIGSAAASAPRRSTASARKKVSNVGGMKWRVDRVRPDRRFVFQPAPAPPRTNSGPQAIVFVKLSFRVDYSIWVGFAHRFWSPSSRSSNS
jgi:hypothetical protein